MTKRKDLGFPRLDVSIPELWRQKSWKIISENRRCLSSCWHPVTQKRIREGRGKDLYLRKLASARQTFQYWGIFPTGANMLLWKRTKYPLSLWEFLSSPKGPQIWENFFPLLSTCTYDVSAMLWSLLSQCISQLSLIIRHIFIHGLWSLISASGPHSATLKTGFWILLPGKRINPSWGTRCPNDYKLQ